MCYVDIAFPRYPEILGTARNWRARSQLALRGNGGRDALTKLALDIFRITWRLINKRSKYSSRLFPCKVSTFPFQSI